MLRLSGCNFAKQLIKVLLIYELFGLSWDQSIPVVDNRNGEQFYQIFLSFSYATEENEGTLNLNFCFGEKASNDFPSTNVFTGEQIVTSFKTVVDSGGDDDSVLTMVRSLVSLILSLETDELKNAKIFGLTQENDPS